MRWKDVGISRSRNSIVVREWASSWRIVCIMAAVISPNTREYHPVRSMHDRFLQLLALGVTPGHVAFPQQSWDRYLRGDVAAISEDHRLALGQYVGIIEQLLQAGVTLDQPGTQSVPDTDAGQPRGRSRGCRGRSTGGQSIAPGATGGRRRRCAPPAVEQSLGDWAEQRMEH